MPFGGTFRTWTSGSLNFERCSTYFGSGKFIERIPQVQTFANKFRSAMVSSSDDIDMHGDIIRRFESNICVMHPVEQFADSKYFSPQRSTQRMRRIEHLLQVESSFECQRSSPFPTASSFNRILLPTFSSLYLATVLWLSIQPLQTWYFNLKDSDKPVHLRKCVMESKRTQ